MGKKSKQNQKKLKPMNVLAMATKLTEIVNEKYKKMIMMIEMKKKTKIII